MNKLIESIKKDFTTSTLVLIPVVIAINIVLGEIALLLKLPVYLDGTGTIFLAVICGPWAGALTGILTNIIWGLAIDPNAFPWFPVAAFIGLVAGIMANKGLFKKWWQVVITGFVIAIFTTIVSTPIAVYLYGGITASGTSFITAMLLQSGQDLVTAVLSTNFLTDPLDKITSALMAFAVLKALSARYLSRFPHAENVVD
ncbi:MAG: ECF transporter S component [Anaerolineales bacterium]|nr:ECF transporter S component [Anaerolineales bacterium]